MTTNRSLTRVVGRGITWTAGASVIALVMQLAYTASMSRLLTPSEFGLMAAALLALRVITQATRLGLGNALIQRPAVDHQVVSTALGLSAVLGMLSAGLVVLAAPLLTRLVSDPEAARVAMWLAPSVGIGVISSVTEAYARRMLRFRYIATVKVLSTAVGFFGVGIPLALSGYGALSLVAATTVQASMSLVATAPAALAAGRVGPNVAEARRLVAFGGGVTFISYLEAATNSLHQFVIGAVGGASALGQLSRAQLLVALPVETLTTATQQVMFPGLVAAGSGSARWRRAVMTTLQLQSVLVVVPLALLGVAAPLVVPWFFGPGWEVAEQLVPLVAVGTAAALVTHVVGVAAEAAGALRIKASIQAGTLALTAVALTAAFVNEANTTTFVLVWSTTEVLRLVASITVIGPRIGITVRSSARSIATSVTVAAIAAAPMWGVVRALPHFGMGAVMIGGIVATLAVGGLSLIRPFGELRDQVRAALRAMIG